MKQALLFLLVGLGLWGCYAEDRLAADLEGSWEITALYPADTTAFAQVDSLRYVAAFLPCADAYTANCDLVLSVEIRATAQVLAVDTFKHVLKDQEINVVSSVTQAAPDLLLYNNLWRLRRFLVENLQENTFTLRRYDNASIYMTLEKQNE